MTQPASAAKAGSLLSRTKGQVARSVDSTGTTVLEADLTPLDDTPLDDLGATPAAPVAVAPVDDLPSPARRTVAPVVDPDRERRANARATRAGKSKRFTLDLEPADHRALKIFALTHDVHASKVMRACINLLEEDPTFADAVLARVDEILDDEQPKADDADETAGD